MAQFLYNRLLFFYITNSDYSTAAAISLHLTGFFIGCWIARKSPPGSAVLATLLSIVLTLLSKTITWDVGTSLLPAKPLVALIVLLSVTSAGIAGFFSLHLIRMAENQGELNRVVLADGVGSVLGAILAGFLLLPHFGISILFVVILGTQITVFSLCVLGTVTVRPFLIKAVSVLAITAALASYATVHWPPAFERVHGFPLGFQRGEANVLASETSTYGIVSAVDVESQKIRALLLDNRVLCFVPHPNTADNYMLLSEYKIGERTVHAALSDTHAGRIAIIGLGCGLTLQAALSNLSPDAKIDVIEINPRMPDFAKYFKFDASEGIHDPRVTLVIDDAFRYFASRSDDAQKYDAVIMDVAIGESTYNVAHLFSKEMYQNIARHLAPQGVLAIWTPEDSPFSQVSRVMRATIADVFPVVMNVSFDDRGPEVTHFAAKSAFPGFHQSFDSHEREISNYVSVASKGSPINTLDSLVINRMPFAALVPDYQRTRDAQIRQ